MTKLLPGLCLTLLFVTYPALADTISGKVVRVADGDTITVLRGKTQYKIRLVGIDAPEKAQAYGNQSKLTLSEAIAGQTVTVDYNKKDRYGRIIGKVLYTGQDMNLRQIQLGMAWHYKAYEREQDVEDRSIYAQAEYIAQREKLGLWADKKSIPPWEYRKTKK